MRTMKRMALTYTARIFEKKHKYRIKPSRAKEQSNLGDFKQERRRIDADHRRDKRCWDAACGAFVRERVNAAVTDLSRKPASCGWRGCLAASPRTQLGRGSAHSDPPPCPRCVERSASEEESPSLPLFFVRPLDTTMTESVHTACIAVLQGECARHAHHCSC